MLGFGYVIYNTETTRLLVRRSFKTPAAAKAALTREARKGRCDPNAYSIADSQEFARNIEQQVERTNLQSGKPYKEGINTPAFLSPACETYWSF